MLERNEIFERITISVVMLVLAAFTFKSLFAMSLPL
jgi:hypothetical protein